MVFFLKGLVVGIAICVPMGSVGILGIQRVISRDRLSGFVVGLGSIVADIIFGAIAVYSLSVIFGLIDRHQFGLSVFGGILLFYIGLNIFFSKPKEVSTLPPFFTLAKDFSAGFLLSITNPLTLIAILALFSWFGINGATDSAYSILSLLLGFLVGLLLWWYALTGIVNKIKLWITVPSFKIMNKIFGVILVILAILILARVL